MDLRIGFRGENGKLHHIDDYAIEEAELERLKKDFEEYIGSGTVNPKGGVYKCTHFEKPSLLFLKFDEIVYIG